MKKLSNKYSVLTKDGFKKFEGIKKTISNKGLILKFSDKSCITCTYNHLFLYKNNYIEASKLKVGDIISNKEITEIEELHEIKEYFDLLNVSDGNNYLTSNITSHNCAFIRATRWEEFADSIFPSQSGLAWKKNIILSTANGMNHFYELVKGARNDTNGYKIFEVDWRDVPRFNHDGTIKKPEKFMTDIINKHGMIYFNQNYACVSGLSVINIFDKETQEYYETTVEEFERLLNQE